MRFGILPFGFRGRRRGLDDRLRQASLGQVRLRRGRGRLLRHGIRRDGLVMLGLSGLVRRNRIGILGPMQAEFAGGELRLHR
ncbi:hypothetical protein, partial [Methylobacterium indicum]|uniref:hypothetical protein n=1 Tax=Methylobacterium indicum TaxID=1775910 RepID=UPI00114697A4